MKEAVLNGRYVWMAPVGYKNVVLAEKANIAPSEMAPLIKETFEKIATGFYAIEDVRRLMTKKGLLSRKNKPILKSYFYKLLRNVTYIGLIDKFGEVHKGAFEPIITEELFTRVQRVIKNRGKKMTQYKLDNEDFPLRRFIFNKENQKLTGSWSTGRNEIKYPFYKFGSRGSNHRRDDLNEMFMTEMDRHGLRPEHILKLKKFLRDRLQKNTRNSRVSGENLKNKLSGLESQQSALIQKNLNGFISDELLKRQLDEIDAKKFDLEALLGDLEAPEHNIDGLMAFTEQYLQKPSTVWKDVSLDKKVKLQWFQFPSGLVFNGTKFETTEVASIFKTKEVFQPLLSTRVDLTGFEPAASSVQMRRSTK